MLANWPVNCQIPFDNQEQRGPRWCSR